MSHALEEWMTAQEAAAELGVSRPRIHQLASAGRLEASRRAGRLFIRRASLQELGRSRRSTGLRASKRITMHDLRQLRDLILSLGARHGARDFRVFGSVARGRARPDSDVDFLVTMDPGRTVLDLAELIVDLEELLGRPVDVVEMKRPLRAAARIQAEAIAL